MSDELKILVIEDSADDYDLLIREVRKAGYHVKSERIETAEELERSLPKQWDIVISDNKLPRLNAPTALKLTRAFDLNIPFFIVSGTIGEEAAVEAMRAGANDYLLKGNLKRLIPAIARELKEVNNRQRRAAAEQKLAKSQKMYQFLSGSIEDAFIALDHNLKIIHCNGAAKKEFNATNDILGDSILSMFPDWAETSIEHKIISVKEKSKSEHISFEYDNSEYFEGSIYPTEEGVSIIIKKVTEQKQAEENLRKINNELETLMYRISHDLKGPVASILGLINIGRMDFKDEDFVKYLGMLDKSAFQLKKTLDELLNLTRIKQGQIVPEPVVLQEVINDITEGLKYNEGFQEVEIIVNLKPTHVINNDRRLLTSIFQNLLENAIKYRDTSRNRKSWVFITANRTERTLRVQIQDNGEGISKKLQEKVFDMFYRANEFSTGSGLGLYIVKNAVEKIKGSITLESKKGEGCRFEVIIPELENKSND